VHPNIPALEVDLQAAFAWPKKLQPQWDAWIARGGYAVGSLMAPGLAPMNFNVVPESVVLMEAIQIIVEKSKPLHLREIWFRFPKWVYSLQPDTLYQLARAFEGAQRDSEIPFAFELNEDQNYPFGQGIQWNWVFDPAWPAHAEEIEIRSRRQFARTRFKVHGWHPERWMRAYSKDALLAMWNTTFGCMRDQQSVEPLTFFFAHSQRDEQFGEFLTLGASKPSL
jgi:hypothetical protein